MTTHKSSGPRPEDGWPPGRWVLIRDAVVFQVKLLVDGLRDFVLLPISVVAALLSLLRGGNGAGREFYTLVAFGRRTEKWINLFGAADRLPAADEPDDDSEIATVDGLVNKLERKVVEQYEKGGMTASAKHAIDHILDSVQSSTARRDPGRHS